MKPSTIPPAYKWPGPTGAPGAPPAGIPVGEQPEPPPEGNQAATDGAQAVEAQSKPEPSRPKTNPSERSSLSYMPALDGLRAVAVLAVLAYHAGLSWAPAGFLGVDVFFVISGYLITALLLGERTRTGSVNLARFWKRRALRLLPALLVLLAAVALVVPILAPDQNESLKGDLVAALTYSSNWWLIFQDQPYFEAIGRPPLLQHLWSLAVEEQFYLLWPLVLAFVLKNPFRKPRRLVKWILISVAASALTMAVLYSPEGDASRVYYGTDTRLGTILLGAALAFMWSPGSRTVAPRWRGNLVRDFAGLGALAAILWLMTTWNEFEPALYRGGFTLVALLTVVVVAVTTQPGILTRGLLANLPMRWLGQRSYSIYLWHWPVFMVTRPELDITLTGIPLAAVRLGLTLSLAAASYHFVERPVRDGLLGRAWGRVKGGVPSPRAAGRFAAGVALLILPVLLGGVVAAGIVLPREAPAPDAARAFEESGHLSTATSAMSPMDGVEVTETAEPVPPPEPAPELPAAPIEPPPPGSVTAIGDSVMVIAKDALAGRLGNAVVDAAIGRQTKAIIETTRTLKEGGQLGDAVIVHMGTNGLITVKQFDQLMELLADVPRVAVVNVKVARPWEEVNNRMLAENIGRFPNARLVDWKSTASAHPEAFYKDGVHLRPSGVGIYVDLLSGSVAAG